MNTRTQKGYALLITTSLILLGLAINALIVSKSMNIEQRSQSNEYQQQMGFQAAEAALEYGVAYLFNNNSAILQDSNNDGIINSYTNPAITNASLPNGARFNVSYTNTVAFSYRTIEVTATGYSNNGESQRTIRELVTIYPLLVNTPPAGVVTRNSVDLSGNITISNTQSGTTIWSGGSVGLSGSAATATSSGTGSNSSAMGSDVVSNDTNLSSLSGDQFFNAFFGQTKTQAQQNSRLVYSNSASTEMGSALNGVTGQSIWINQTSGEARFNSNITIGSPLQPVILIVNGPLKMNGTVTVYGIVYVIGDWDNNGGGNLTINGGVVVEGNLLSTGTPNVNFSQSILGNLNQIGMYVKVPGSWRDF